MKLIGRWDSSAATAYNAAADTAYGDLYALDRDTYIVNMSAKLDGGGSGSGAQVVRGAIYDSTGTTLLGYSEDVEVADDAEVGWVHLPFTEPLALVADDYLLSIDFSLPTNALRYYGSSGNDGYTQADTFDDGPAATFSLATPGKSPLVLAAYVDDRAQPDEVDTYYARLGFYSAQATLGETGPEAGSRVRAICGWHGTWLDPETQGSSFAIVQRDGDLAEMVGERIRVTYQGRSVAAYVHREADLDTSEGSTTADDLSLARRLYAALAPLSTESLTVHVEVLGAAT